MHRSLTPSDGGIIQLAVSLQLIAQECDEGDVARSYHQNREKKKKKKEVLVCSTLKSEFQGCVLWGSEKWRAKKAPVLLGFK